MNFSNLMSGLLSNKKMLLILFITVVFIGLAFYVYKKHVVPRLQPEYVPNKEFVEESTQEKEAELYFFYTEWCPHCKKAKPIMSQLEKDYQNKTINNTRIIFRNIDCDKDEKTADDFNVEGYPTVKLVANGQVIEYDAKPNYDNLVEFLNTSL
jgi:thiol-disulfide isomerase/thioredoxin